MKPILLTILFSIVICINCEKDINDIQQNDIELPIVSELPVMYYGCNLKEDQTVVIKDQVGFDTVFNQSLVSQLPALQNFDFTKYNILLGADVYTHGIFKLEHNFILTADSEYIYTVEVYYYDTLPAGGFYYGIVIDKLPLNTIVKFEVINALNNKRGNLTNI